MLSITICISCTIQVAPFLLYDIILIMIVQLSECRFPLVFFIQLNCFHKIGGGQVLIAEFFICRIAIDIHLDFCYTVWRCAQYISSCIFPDLFNVEFLCCICHFQLITLAMHIIKNVISFILCHAANKVCFFTCTSCSLISLLFIAVRIFLALSQPDEIIRCSTVHISIQRLCFYQFVERICLQIGNIITCLCARRHQNGSICPCCKSTAYILKYFARTIVLIKLKFHARKYFLLIVCCNFQHSNLTSCRCTGTCIHMVILNSIR